MSNSAAKAAPPDQLQRVVALDASRSILVQAPAGSGKTDLLTRRFLLLLGEVEDPGQIVAITFTKAAAAEMRQRILSELEKASIGAATAADEFSMDALARRALARSRALGWQLPDLSAQLHISTIDSFSRDLAVQQPLVSGFGSDLEISQHPAELYRRAARRTLEQIAGTQSALCLAIEDLLLWRDNAWHDMENLLVEMLGQRDRWMQEFWLRDFATGTEQDWQSFRERLERPFTVAVRSAIDRLNLLLDEVPNARTEAMALARFACDQSDGALHRDLSELVEFPAPPFTDTESLEDARRALVCLATLLLTNENAFRLQVNKANGFPADRKAEKNRFLNLLRALGSVDGLESALAAIRSLPPARYTEEDWQIVRACFTLLRHAAAELRAVFAEAGTVDFIEVSQTAQQILLAEDGTPSDAAIAVADGIRHLLVDEFQDTSRRQHRLVASIAAAWPGQDGRTIFVVGDPMQSIYFFRDADAELFPRLRDSGLEIPQSDPFLFDPVRLTANFRTAPALVDQLNDSFAKVFAENDGSGVTFALADPVREPVASNSPGINLHLEFMPQTSQIRTAKPDALRQKEAVNNQREAARDTQIAEIVSLIGSHLPRVEQAGARAEKYRIAVLGRTRSALAPIALALRKAAIPFRAIELEQLKDRPEVLDALALARALLNSHDRVAWLGVLRAPWCGLSLSDLHALTSADDAELLERPIPQLLAERLHLLDKQSRARVERVLNATAAAPSVRDAQPTAALGTWLEQVWLGLGAARCVDPAARANLDLLWASLDTLPGGEPDLLGPAMNSALESLTALPDPAANSECGVQLMTIHKSKGLEFEVVIVPELQARCGSTRGKLLSWLERGLAEPDDSGEVTEFLVAPLQSKGTNRGQAKEWVDRVYCQRESQEMRRILYVAATRAREELHLFVRPEFKGDELTLVEPRNSLFATAWPALAERVQARFEAWKAATADAESVDESVIETIAASAESNLILMPSPAKPTLLCRLPHDFEPDQEGRVCGALLERQVGASDSQLYHRHEGGAHSRALGNAVHKLLEELARLRSTYDWDQARGALAQLEPRIVAQVRASGAKLSEAESIAAQAFEVARQAAEDPRGQWILSPHTEAASEASWNGIVGGVLRSVRVDRIFRAGAEPLAADDGTFWIIDYKTAHADNLDPSTALPGLHSLFAPQLEAYAAVLRNLHGEKVRIRAALYYPRMSLLDWWPVES